MSSYAVKIKVMEKKNSDDRWFHRGNEHHCVEGPVLYELIHPPRLPTLHLLHHLTFLTRAGRTVATATKGHLTIKCNYRLL